MPIPFECPKCGKRGKAKDSFAGKRAKCKCGHILDFPQPQPDPKPTLGEVANESGGDPRTGLERRVERVPVPGERRGGEDRRQATPSGGISFGCPACTRQFSVDPQLAGRSLNCPDCHAQVLVPNPPASAHIAGAASKNRNLIIVGMISGAFLLSCCGLSVIITVFGGNASPGSSTTGASPGNRTNDRASAGPSIKELEEEKARIIKLMDDKGETVMTKHMMGYVLYFYLSGQEQRGTYMLNAKPALRPYKKVAIKFRNLCRASEELHEKNKLPKDPMPSTPKRCVWKVDARQDKARIIVFLYGEDEKRIDKAEAFLRNDPDITDELDWKSFTSSSVQIETSGNDPNRKNYWIMVSFTRTDPNDFRVILRPTGKTRVQTRLKRGDGSTFWVTYDGKASRWQKG